MISMATGIPLPLLDDYDHLDPRTRAYLMAAIDKYGSLSLIQLVGTEHVRQEAEAAERRES